MSDGSESSAQDIPSRKQLNHRKQEEAKKEAQKDNEKPAAGNEDVDMEEEEEEYVVEKILAHKFFNKVLKLKVKWQGFAEEDCTWEPMENLDGASEETDAYFKKIGGRPQIGDAKVDKKRKLSQAAVDTPSPATGGKARGSKKLKADQSSEGSRKKPVSSLTDSSLTGGAPAEWKPPSGDWEDHVSSVDTMLMDEKTGVLMTFLRFKDGNCKKFSNEVCNRKCPQKMIAFYERNLQFNNIDATPQKTVAGASDLTERTKTPQSNGKPTGREKEVAMMKNEDEAEGYVEDDAEDYATPVEEEENVKGVATAVA